MRITEPDPDNQPTRDDSQLALLRNDMGDAADEVVAAYQETISGELQNLRGLSDQAPGADSKRHAHTIKSSSLAIGAMRLAHLGAQLEKAIHNGEAVDLPAAIAGLEQEFKKYLTG